ncbi:VanZ family protein [Halegenticoccus soli]|uniref:VanZ family protein n=1 Tax=Halegenticoccus soli TaxID=1985678 RepID=UPI001179B565|nr:VanZ family protein [Halegenticoccus soli]
MFHRAARNRLRWVVVGCLAVGLLVASVISSPAGAATGGPLGLVGLDKWLHALGYGALAAAIAAAGSGRGPRAALLAALAALCYGVAVEAVQAFVPARRVDAADVVANGVGAVVGATLVDRAVPAVRRTLVRARRGRP